MFDENCVVAEIILLIDEGDRGGAVDCTVGVGGWHRGYVVLLPMA